MENKICPLMSRPIASNDASDVSQYSHTVFVECQKENCALWTTVWTTENLREVGCAFVVSVGVNSEGKFVV